MIDGQKIDFFAISEAKHTKKTIFRQILVPQMSTALDKNKIPYFSAKKTTKDAEKTAIDGPKTDFLLFLGPNILKTIFLQILVPQMSTPALDKNKIPYFSAKKRRKTRKNRR